MKRILTVFAVFGLGVAVGTVLQEKSPVGALGEAGRPAVHSLAGLLKNPDWDVRAAVARALGRVGRNDPSAVQALVPCLVEALGDPEARLPAVRVFAHLGPRAAGAAFSLLDSFWGQDLDFKVAALGALKGMGPGIALLVVEYFSKHQWDQRGPPELYELLGALTPSSREAIPALKSRLSRSHEEKLLTLRALSAMGPLEAGVLEEIRTLAQNPEESVEIILAARRALRNGSAR